MKATLPSTKTVKILALTVSFLSILFSANSQTTSTELTFENVSLTSGTAGTVGAVYTFSNVTPDMDAQVKISGTSDNLVSVSNIDLTGTGFNKAFQPLVSYNGGSISGAANWWMEFEITFVKTATVTPTSISSFHVTGLDIDGDNSTVNEYQVYYGAGSYTLESGSVLTASNVSGNSTNASVTGKEFDGPITNFANIDTSATSVMVTLTYANTSKLTMRVGGNTLSGGATERMYSMWFKSFDYNTPQIKILPVKLTAFNAMLINNTNKVNLSWTTATEENVNRFEVQKSIDGKNYSTTGVVLAAGNSTSVLNYKYADNINLEDSKIIYYRLKSVDEDGRIEYSSVRIIRIGGEELNSISLLTYPNPVVNELRITIPNNWQGKKVTYDLVNANGQIAKRTESSSSSQTETINMSTVAPGLYIVSVTCDGTKAQQKIIKR